MSFDVHAWNQEIYEAVDKTKDALWRKKWDARMEANRQRKAKGGVARNSRLADALRRSNKRKAPKSPDD